MTGITSSTPPINSPGIGSGINISSIVSQLMAVNSQPLTQLQTQGTTLQSEISAYGQIKAAVSTFNDAISSLSDPTKFAAFTANSSDSTIVGATTSAGAASGVYNITVNQLATNHQMASNSTFVDTNTTAIGAAGDAMTVTVGTKPFSVQYGGMTLSQLSSAINSNSNNTGVTASIIKDDAGYRLSLTSNQTGSANAISLSYSGSDPFAMTTLNVLPPNTSAFTPANLDASVTLDGQYKVTSSSNTLSETIQGVSLTLQKPGTVTVTVGQSSSTVQTSVQNLVSAYNALMATVQQAGAGALQTDTGAIYNLESQMRAALSTAGTIPNSGFSNVFQVGISTNSKDGSLSLNSDILTGAIAQDYQGVANLFTDPSKGIAVQLKNLANNFLSTDGPIASKIQGLTNQVSQNQSQQKSLQTQLTSVQDRLTAQYQALDTLVAKLQQSDTLLNSQLASLYANEGITTNSTSTTKIG